MHPALIFLKILLLCLGSMYLLWAVFLAAMDLDEARNAGMLTLPVKILGYPLIVAGLLVDLLVDWGPATLLFLEFPREYTVSDRLGRLVRTTGWRQSLALWIAMNLLNSVSGKGTPHIDLSGVKTS
jgi:hypothetical protein